MIKHEQKHSGREGYYVEHNGDCYQSVFPTDEANKSQLHTSVADALAYMVDECGVILDDITVLGNEP